jgi:hypothetical protein
MYRFYFSLIKFYDLSNSFFNSFPFQLFEFDIDDNNDYCVSTPRDDFTERPR